MACRFAAVLLALVMGAFAAEAKDDRLSGVLGGFLKKALEGDNGDQDSTGGNAAYPNDAYPNDTSGQYPASNNAAYPETDPSARGIDGAILERFMGKLLEGRTNQ